MHKLWISPIMGKWSIVLLPLLLCPNLTAVRFCSACAHCAVPGTIPCLPPPALEKGNDWQASGGADSTHSLLIAGNCPHLWQWGKVQLYLGESQASQLILYPGKVNELVFLSMHPWGIASVKYRHFEEVSNCDWLAEDVPILIFKVLVCVCICDLRS